MVKKLSAKDPLLWAAIRIVRALEDKRQNLSTVGQYRHSVASVGHHYEQLLKNWENLQRAENREWSTAVSNATIDFQISAMRLKDEIVYLANIELKDQPRVPSIRDVLADLRQLEDEFDEVRIDVKKHQVIAVTPPITLNGLYLGPFSIELQIPSHDTDKFTYECVALEPNYPTGSDSITHPHVDNNGLCAGDAKNPLSLALAQGRIADAFLMIKAVLNEYSKDSPYRAISAWNGHNCGGCDNTYDDDNSGGSCQSCGESYCDDCISSCDNCDEHYCTGCLDYDRVAQENLCAACRSCCEKCGRTCNSDNINSDTSYCPKCHEKYEAEQDALDEKEDNADSNPSDGIVPRAPSFIDQLTPVDRPELTPGAGPNRIPYTHRGDHPRSADFGADGSLPDDVTVDDSDEDLVQLIIDDLDEEE